MSIAAKKKTYASENFAILWAAFFTVFLGLMVAAFLMRPLRRAEDFRRALLACNQRHGALIQTGIGKDILLYHWVKYRPPHYKCIEP